MNSKVDFVQQHICAYHHGVLLRLRYAAKARACNTWLGKQEQGACQGEFSAYHADVLRERGHLCVIPLVST